MHERPRERSLLSPVRLWVLDRCYANFGEFPSETVWKFSTEPTTEAREPTKGQMSPVFGAWLTRCRQSRRPKAIFQTVSPRTWVDRVHQARSELVGCSEGARIWDCVDEQNFISAVWRDALAIIQKYPLATILPAAVLGALAEAPAYLIADPHLLDNALTYLTAAFA